jgi:SAM-dependent methyltransferase
VIQDVGPDQDPRLGLARLRRYIPGPLVPGARRIYRLLGRPGRSSGDTIVARVERAAAKVEREATRAAHAAARAEAAAIRAEQATARAMPSLSESATPRSRAELHDYWREPDAANRAEGYANPIERSEFLLDLLEPFVSRDEPILEIGPNVGRNLEHLRRAGFKHLAGIEISAKALEAMHAVYPDLVPVVKIYNAPVEDVIRDIPDLSYGAVFTMAVLEHIHPDSDWIFAEMVRVCRGVIVTIEDEESQTWRHVPRDYRSIFEGLGMIQVREADPSAIGGFGKKFRARVLRRTDTT